MSLTGQIVPEPWEQKFGGLAATPGRRISGRAGKGRHADFLWLNTDVRSTVYLIAFPPKLWCCSVKLRSSSLLEKAGSNHEILREGLEVEP